MKDKVILVSGAAHRVGKQIARTLHESGAKIIIHYRRSQQAAEQLSQELNTQRANSAQIVCADLDQQTAYESLIAESHACFGQLDALINNASEFFPTEIGTVTPENWDSLFNSNLKAPFFLAQAALPHLRKTSGNIINIVDIHADRPMKGYPVYCMAKAGLAMMTKALAKELGPDIRVNGVAPGAVMWPDDMPEDVQNEILARTALKKPGSALDIAKTVRFILQDAPYMTGQIIAIDGGRSLNV
ncbi:MAG: pteridine reductase [Gammaproteobacteria bacterium]|nr:pteridine reductase [Gammaproteobacteria bacterium]